MKFFVKKNSITPVFKSILPEVKEKIVSFEERKAENLLQNMQQICRSENKSDWARWWESKFEKAQSSGDFSEFINLSEQYSELTKNRHEARGQINNLQGKFGEKKIQDLKTALLDIVSWQDVSMEVRQKNMTDFLVALKKTEENTVKVENLRPKVRRFLEQKFDGISVFAASERKDLANFLFSDLREWFDGKSTSNFDDLLKNFENNFKALQSEAKTREEQIKSSKELLENLDEAEKNQFLQEFNKADFFSRGKIIADKNLTVTPKTEISENQKLVKNYLDLANSQSWALSMKTRQLAEDMLNKWEQVDPENSAIKKLRIKLEKDQQKAIMGLVKSTNKKRKNFLGKKVFDPKTKKESWQGGAGSFQNSIPEFQKLLNRLDQVPPELRNHFADLRAKLLKNINFASENLHQDNNNQTNKKKTLKDRVLQMVTKFDPKFLMSLWGASATMDRAPETMGTGETSTTMTQQEISKKQKEAREDGGNGKIATLDLGHYWNLPSMSTFQEYGENIKKVIDRGGQFMFSLFGKVKTGENTIQTGIESVSQQMSQQILESGISAADFQSELRNIANDVRNKGSGISNEFQKIINTTHKADDYDYSLAA